jgi:hypothetical protein
MNQPGRVPTPPSGGTQTVKAVVVIAAVVIIGVVVLHHNPKSTVVGTTPTTHARHSTTTTTRSGVPPAPTTTVPLVPPSSIKLQVLNGVLTGSLAGEWSVKLKANPGYNTLPPDNATAKVAQSEIYVLTPGYLPEARSLAAAVGLPASAVNPTVPAPLSAPIPPAERTAANLVLVIGPDLAGSA